GGRISSVMDIAMNDGNQKKWTTEGGVGLIAAHVKVEGPLSKDKSSFMVSARRTYADMFLKVSNNEDINQSKHYFYDLNAKLNYRVDDKTSLYLFGYFGRDDLGYSDLFSCNWGNATAAVRRNHIYNDKRFINTSLIHRHFNYIVHVSNDDSHFGLATTIHNS